VNRGVSAFQQELGWVRSIVCTPTYVLMVDTMQVRLVVERKNERDTSIIGCDMEVGCRETRDITCYRRRFQAEPRALVSKCVEIHNSNHSPKIAHLFILNSLLLTLLFASRAPHPRVRSDHPFVSFRISVKLELLLLVGCRWWTRMSRRKKDEAMLQT
jgi:hypothetical protein